MQYLGDQDGELCGINKQQAMKLPLFYLFFFPITLLAQRPEQATDKHFWHTTTTVASSPRIWEIWTDVPNWKDWDTGLEDATITMPFALGAKGTIVSNGRKSKFTVVSFTAGKSYTIKMKLPLGGLYVRRFMEKTAEGLSITHEVWFKGLTSGLFARMLGQDFRKKLPSVVEAVKTRAEK